MRSSSSRAGRFALLVLLCAALLAAQVWLPREGAGLAVRHAIETVLTVGLVAALVAVVALAVHAGRGDRAAPRA